MNKYLFCFLLLTPTLIQAKSLTQTLGNNEEDISQNISEEVKSQLGNKLHEINGVIYYIEEELSVTWTEAALECRKQEMFLASFETSQELVPVYQYLFKKGKFWTSGRYLADKWVWMTSDEKFTLNSFWIKNNPHIYDINDSYIAIHKKGIEDEKNDVKLHFICEY